MSESSIPASIVIPVYKESFLTRLCLASLELADLAGAEIVVVDNGSTDDTPALLAGWSDGRCRRVVRLDENLGFGRGCNLGAAASRGDILIFLNNDTFVLANWLIALLRAFDDPTVTVAGSRLLYPNGRVQHAGVAFNDHGPHHVFVGLRGDLPLVLEPRDCQVVTGASLAIRRSEFERLGGFDEMFVNSFEDVDLCLKVKRDGGRVVYVPDSVAYHWESMTEGRVGPTDMRNYELFVDRWKGRWVNDLDDLIAAAQAAGYDLTDRTPSRREMIDRQKQMEELASHLEEIKRRQQQVEERLRRLAEMQEEWTKRIEQLERQRQEVEERLRHLTGMRSVRTALWLRNAYRQVVPRRG